MNVTFKHSGIKMKLTYDDDSGILRHIKNIDTNEHMSYELALEGHGYDIKDVNTFIFIKQICDARYVRIVDIDVYVPRLIFINNKK